jgi:hypothetical protein
MKELHGKVAVITGAASGFGREFAIRCADEGMKVILTDIDTGGLGTTVALLKPGTESLVIGSDVSSADSIEHLARSTYDRFGACHLLFNNAGVGTAGPIWTATLDDWKWTLGINVMGVVHGLRSFVPRMLAQKEESYIVNTASAAGLLAPPGSGVYAASKHAVVAITECRTGPGFSPTPLEGCFYTAKTHTGHRRPKSATGTPVGLRNFGVIPGVMNWAVLRDFAFGSTHMCRLSSQTAASQEALMSIKRILVPLPSSAHRAGNRAYLRFTKRPFSPDPAGGAPNRGLRQQSCLRPVACPLGMDPSNYAQWPLYRA